MSETVYGIDLGTTFCSCCSTTVGSTDIDSPLDVDPNASTKGLLASIVCLDADASGGIRAYVGSEARRQIQNSQKLKGEPELIRFAKRYIGLSGDQTKTWRFGGYEFDPVDISAIILRKIRKMVEEATGEKMARAVVTHPRDFTVTRRDATAEALRTAGIELIDTLNEPEAAIFSYFDPGGEREPGVYMIFDLGGGTLDIALLEVPKDGRPKIIGGHGEPQLGGADWDKAMLELMLESGRNFHNMDYMNEISPLTFARLEDIACEWKINVTNRAKPTMQKEIESRFIDGNVAQTLFEVNIEEWERRCEPLVARCSQAIDIALSGVGLRTDQVMTVIPVGGSTRLRGVQKMLRARFESRFVPVSTRECGGQLDYGVAMGAARFASFEMARVLERKGVRSRAAKLEAILKDFEPETTLSHGINVLAARRTPSGECQEYLDALIEKGATLPADRKKSYCVTDPGDVLEVGLFEGPPGAFEPGLEPSALLSFAPTLNAAAGDLLTVAVHATQSGRISASAFHERSKSSIEVVLKAGSECASGGAPSPAKDRKKMLSMVEVI